MPLTGTPIGKSQLSGHQQSTRHAQPRSINPALSFLQDTPVTPAHTSSSSTFTNQQNLANAAIASSHIIKNYQQSSFHQQQKPTHKPVIIIPQTTTYDVLYHIPPTTAQPRSLGIWYFPKKTKKILKCLNWEYFFSSQVSNPYQLIQKKTQF